MYPELGIEWKIIINELILSKSAFTVLLHLIHNHSQVYDYISKVLVFILPITLNLPEKQIPPMLTMLGEAVYANPRTPESSASNVW
jgi:hypothetical protein